MFSPLQLPQFPYNKSKNKFFICIAKVRKWRLRTLSPLQMAAHPKPLDSDSSISCTVLRLPLARVYLEVDAKKMFPSYSSLPVCAAFAETVRDKSVTRIDTRKPCCSKACIFCMETNLGTITVAPDPAVLCHF